jgi:hypothetical protein
VHGAMRGLFLPRALLIVLSLFSVSASRASIRLVDVHPQEVRSTFPGRDVNPQPVMDLRLRSREPRQAVRFTTDSEITYAVPPGQNTFSGVLAYADVNAQDRNQGPSSPNRVRVQFMTDGKVVFETVMDDQTPPEAFSISVAGAHRLTIASEEDYSWTVFALADAEFSESSVDVSSSFLPEPAAGYIDVTPLVRQGMFHVFRPGEIVPVSVYLGGVERRADVTIRLTPEQAVSATSEITIPVSLHRNSVGGSEGKVSWTVPAWRGPASLRLKERVSGRTVFERQFRVAIAPEVYLSKIANSTFGLHTSSPGFLRPQDEFASLWGAKWDRIFIRWEVVESARGQYDFSRPDAIVDSLLRQNISILGVLGEASPPWAGAPGPAHYAAWKQFVEQAARHYRGKIGYWDVFNEVDVKYEQQRAQAQEFDLNFLRPGIASVHEDSRATVVCCSPGTTPWLLYYQRLFDAGLLPAIDVVSLHPYQLVAPEEKDGAFNYEERLIALDRLVQSYGGQRKRIWSTEANWILGNRGEPDVTAPDLDEHTQAEYVVRVNLLSLAHSVPYFLHMPFYHSHHKQIHLDTLAAYANMASLLSEATNTRRLMDDSHPQIYGFAWETPNSIVTAVWTLYGKATVAISGLRSPQIVDFYGNPVAVDSSSLRISAAPTYVVARSATAPKLRVIQGPLGHAWRSLPPVKQWSLTTESTSTSVKGGIEITSQPAKYAYQLRSPDVSVKTSACYIVRAKMNLKRGSAMLFAVDKQTGKQVGNIAYVAYVPDGTPHDVRLRFVTGPVPSVQLLFANANLQPAVSQFEVLDPVQIAPCP